MAVSSMTGFGSAERSWTLDDPAGAPRRVTAEVRSVNARFLELKIRQPFGAAAEAALRRRLEKRLGRGRVELRVSVETEALASASDSGGALGSFGLAQQRLITAARAVAQVREIASSDVELSPVSPLELLTFAMGRASASDGDPAPPPWLDALIDEALEGLVTMRVAEGRALGAVLEGHLTALDDLRGRLSAIATAEPDRLLAAYRQRLETLLAAASAEGLAAPEPDRVAAEVAVLVTRGDVTEELDRIRSHLEQARKVLTQRAARGQGKTLDFLGQELLREFTTVGSKLAHPEASELVIAAKGSLERLREQVQNVE